MLIVKYNNLTFFITMRSYDDYKWFIFEAMGQLCTCGGVSVGVVMVGVVVVVVMVVNVVVVVVNVEVELLVVVGGYDCCGC